MKNHIRIGIIGAGNIVRERHIPGFRAIEDVELVGVVNRTFASTLRAAHDFGIPKTYDNWLVLIDDLDVDAVVIGTWPYLHCTCTIMALEAGKHVLCQARMATDAMEAHYMLASSRGNPQLVAQLAPSPVTLRVDRCMQKLIADGFIGEPLALEVRDCQGFIDPDSPLHWRQDFDLSGYNTMTLGIWYEAIMRWIGEAIRVMATGKTFVRMRKDSESIMRAVRIPDHIDVIAHMASGAQAHFQISRVEGFAGPPDVWLFGTEGTLRFSEGKLFGGRKDGEMAEMPVPPELEGSWQVEKDFIESIRTGKPVTLTSFETGVKYMEFTEAAIRSMMEGKSIPLPMG